MNKQIEVSYFYIGFDINCSSSVITTNLKFDLNELLSSFFFFFMIFWEKWYIYMYRSNHLHQKRSENDRDLRFSFYLEKEIICRWLHFVAFVSIGMVLMVLPSYSILLFPDWFDFSVAKIDQGGTICRFKFSSFPNSGLRDMFPIVF